MPPNSDRIPGFTHNQVKRAFDSQGKLFDKLDEEKALQKLFISGGLGKRDLFLTILFQNLHIKDQAKPNFSEYDHLFHLNFDH